MTPSVRELVMLSADLMVLEVVMAALLRGLENPDISDPAREYLMGQVRTIHQKFILIGDLKLNHTPAEGEKP
jgi:hypothetical protein